MFIEEVKNLVDSKKTSEEIIIKYVKDTIKLWASWGHYEGSFSTSGLRYYFIQSGLVGQEPSFKHMMECIGIIKDFLIKEGFKVKFDYLSFEIIIDVKWENN